MENNTNSNKDKSPKVFNPSWFYALLLIFFIFTFLINPISNLKEISWLHFEQNMLSQYDVEKIVVINKETAEIYIKQERLSDEKYKDIFKSISFNKTEPQYVIKIGSVDSFENKLEKAQQNFSP